MRRSRLGETLQNLSARASAAVVARSRLDAPALNAALLRRLAERPGDGDALIADPVLEPARAWKPADVTLGDLAGALLHEELVAALDGSGRRAPDAPRMPRDRPPYSHQLEAWRGAADGYSCLISSGTGSGKTECFMIPVLNDLLKDQAKGKLRGVRAIVIYPLNALIESQRERLAAWTEPLANRLSFALYNGLTPEKPRDMTLRPAASEIGNREELRASPPSILVTNVTMLEYLLLRTKDQDILDRSQGLLRWIVLDEAHSYVGAQAAEMALLLRRVRAAFGVPAEDVRLMATSATISDGKDGKEKLTRLIASLAGVADDSVRVIEGVAIEPDLPRPQADAPLDPNALSALDPHELWKRLAPHPRIQALKRAMADRGAPLREAARLLLGEEEAGRLDRAEMVLDAAANAICPETGARLIPWRAHLFHRPQGGFWVCVDPSCTHRDPELAAVESRWGFGAVWLRQRETCACKAPVFELVACTECGAVHLRANLEIGARPRLVPYCEVEVDEFAIDREPDPEAETEEPTQQEKVLLRPGRGDRSDRFIRLADGALFDNAPPEGEAAAPISLIERDEQRNCCVGAANAGLMPQRFGPAFFMGNELPMLLESFGEPIEEPGLPMSGRRAITFSDSRQGTARLAAKLQQDAERTLTRAFLYHSAQEGTGLAAEERKKLEDQLAVMRENADLFEEHIRRIEDKLAGGAEPVKWKDLIDRFAGHRELRDFATAVWLPRLRGGRDMADDPRRLAEMFLFRELFRRPKVQNNAETMGLLRLSFPSLEKRAVLSPLPPGLEKAGVTQEDWLGLALAAVDFVFRQNLAVEIRPDWMVRWVSPRSAALHGVARPGLGQEHWQQYTRAWPGPRPSKSRPSHFHRLLYAVIGGDWDSAADQERARDVLESLWVLVSTTAAKDVGGGVYRLDFEKAAVTRLDKGWLCPVTRRVFGYSPAGRSPYDPARRLTPVEFPRLPFANAGGLDPKHREAMQDWCAWSPELAKLRPLGLWTNLHDRIAAYPPFLRAQEHSAQIERPMLQEYEKQFKAGKINLLNCSTTMEMGVDIPNVTLVINANVPPSASNYRQRVGRAGRRGEAFASAMTYCRDLPLDWLVFQTPPRLLSAPIAAPFVWLDSPSLVQRHVNAALLGVFLRDQGGVNVKASMGAFVGAAETADADPAGEAKADAFLARLRGDWTADPTLAGSLAALTRGTALESRGAAQLAATTAEKFERLLEHWRLEHDQLLARRDGAAEEHVKQAFDYRARRMRGEFLLGELARRGFTPAYGFPVDVVSFDHLAGLDRRDQATPTAIALGEPRGGASRTLDVAIREYAPGSEVVVDGLVHLSEGVRPAWESNADDSGLEDLQNFWECRSCRSFGLTRLTPDRCPDCDNPTLSFHSTLRPSGFIGRRTPHTGYENLGHLPFEMPRLSARRATWQALPDARAGRMRADPDGEVISMSSGRHGKGYALCLACGRAEAETEERTGLRIDPPGALGKHRPLAAAKGAKSAGGYCPGGYTEPQRLKRHVRLAHAARSDVFELQLSAYATREQALALGAGLREALADHLGADTREIGVGAGGSKSPTMEPCVSVYLHDRAAGGAGLSTRLGDIAYLGERLAQAAQRLDCPEGCAHGCPACVLRPDLNFGDTRLDRPGGRELAVKIQMGLVLPEPLRLFGPDTRLLGLPLLAALSQRQRTGRLSSATLFLHGTPAEWELGAWPLESLLRALHETAGKPRLVLAADAFSDRFFDLAAKLDLHRLAAHAQLYLSNALPMAQDKPILAILEDHDKKTAVAAWNSVDARPGPSWGLGEDAPLVSGPAPEVQAMQAISSDELMKLSSGNARRIDIGDRLDGPASAFGRAFWKALASDAPLTWAAIKQHGVASAHYTDRYFLTPLNMTLLAQVLAAAPGEPKLAITTARLERAGEPGFLVFHPFAEEERRKEAMRELWPQAALSVRPKPDIEHARSLRFVLGDGRKLTMLLDQGFGGWRSQGAPRHDFQAPAKAQAKAIRSASYAVRAEARETPIILWEGLDAAPS
jgi:DEAD/DEAH box helicase domain-containing protein